MLWGASKKVKTDEDLVEEILTRGVDRIAQEDSLRKKLLSGERLRVKLGIDPTSPNLHLGRGVPLLKLRDFQKLGHQVVLIFGDATAVIGDTSDKHSERPMLTKEEVRENVKTYKEQAGKILDLTKTEIRYNSEWLNDLTFVELGELANLFSVSDFISRENIKKRLDEGKRVSLREVLYPLMQGYDSVQVRADVELGGSDQWFNVLAGRPIQEYYKQVPQDVLTNTLYPGLDGRKMSSSWGNTINFTDEPNDMFGKVMSMKDELIPDFFTGFTRIHMREVTEKKEQLEKGANPRDIKLILAKEIVRMYHGEDAAHKAEQNFINTFSKGSAPEDVQEIIVSENTLLVEVLLDANFVRSKTDFRRLVEAGAVTHLDSEEKIEDLQGYARDGTYKIGKHRFVKIVLK